MNLRNALVGPLVVALIVSLTPAAAHAAPSVTAANDPGMCTVGLVLPKTLAINAYSTRYGARMTGDLDCFFYATWDVSEGLISTGRTIWFYRPDTSGFASWVGAPTTVHALPRQGANSLKTYTDPVTGEQKKFTVIEKPSGTMTVKYDSRVAMQRTSRSGASLTLRASAAQFTTTPSWQPGYSAWPGAKVRFQKLAHGKWHTVRTVRTNARGTAVATVRASRATWRAVTVTTSTVWGKVSGIRKG